MPKHEREKWANIEIGDVLINMSDGRLGRYAGEFEMDSRVAVVNLSFEGHIGWFKHECELYAKKAGDSNA